jgi:hypothetical protein
VSDAATRALRKLLDRAEGAWARDSEVTITLPMTNSSFSAYLDLATLHLKEQFHAAARGAERQGAIAIEWDPLAGKEGQISRLVLRDREKLAAVFGIPPLWEVFRKAESALAAYQDTPAVRNLLAAWRKGKCPRTIGPEDVESVLDSLRVISALDEVGDEDMPVRQLSGDIFGDTKRIERILPVLDYLTQNDETCTLARHPEDVLGALGLVKFPQPVLISGRATARFTNGDALKIPSPYIGLAPQSLDVVEARQDARYILTIENYTTFNEIAKGRAGAIEGIVIYTAGMPSPSFLRFYAMVLAGSPPIIPVYHWGDIDLGGFRIADVIARQVEAFGRRLFLWNMNPTKMEGIRKWTDMSPPDVSWIMTIAQKHGWEDEMEGVETFKVCYEQETMPVCCPPWLDK